MVVARQQTIVQLSDRLLFDLDERAAREGVSRSELIRRAIEAFLHDERKAAIDAGIVDGYTRLPQPEHDRWAAAAAKRSIADEPW